MSLRWMVVALAATPLFAQVHAPRLERVAHFLNLTDDQKAQLQPIVECSPGS